MDVQTIVFLVATVLFAAAAVAGARSPVHLGWAGAAFFALGFVLGAG